MTLPRGIDRDIKEKIESGQQPADTSGFVAPSRISGSTGGGANFNPVTPPVGFTQDTVAHTIPEPDKAEFWKVGDTYYVVYYVPNSDPPIPMAWKLKDKAELDTIQPNAPVKTLSLEQANATGWTQWGQAIELKNTTGHPYDEYISLIADQAKVRPWLRDTEVLTLIMQATLEGRGVTLAEFQQTEWWRTKNEKQRAWLLLSESDPKTAAQILDDNRFKAESNLLDHGVVDAPVELIEYMSKQLTMGNWSQEYYDRQLLAISDPQLGYTIDADLLQTMGGSVTVDTNKQYEDAVRAMVSEWLGPVMGNWSDADVAKWASKFRNTPDARSELETELRRQRLALFPEYENPDLTYNDIAQPWRAKWSQLWGQTADETDPLFMQILRLNDATEAGRRLTETGLARNIQKVKGEAQQAMDSAFRADAGVIGNIR